MDDLDADHLLDALRAWTFETARFDEAFCRRVGVGHADLNALEQLQLSGGMTPGRLGERLQLTSGSVTALADRLERLGLVRRVAHPTDRRTSLLCLTEQAEDWGTEAYGPFGDDLTELAGTLSPEVRAEMVRFFTEAAAIAARHVERQGELSRAARPARPVP